MRISLTREELAALSAPQTGRGGFQGLMRGLQKNAAINHGSLILNPKLIERITRYAFQYNNGGWQNRLRAIFGRTLQPFRAAA